VAFLWYCCKRKIIRLRFGWAQVKHLLYYLPIGVPVQFSATVTRLMYITSMFLYGLWCILVHISHWVVQIDFWLKKNCF